MLYWAKAAFSAGKRAAVAETRVEERDKSIKILEEQPRQAGPRLKRMSRNR